ncbi:MAG: type II toxin-antitoxin system RelE/ParE family toxin [Chloroflexia bacterium]|nr:type II toxin-antitoxin system RelE/ParE family toxin [Chloroflexia bacterium]
MRDVLAFTEAHWGSIQKETYAGRLARAFDDLVHFPELGRARPELGEDVRSHRIGEHIVFYQIRQRELRILRLHHVRRDIEGIAFEALPIR